MKNYHILLLLVLMILVSLTIKNVIKSHSPNQSQNQKKVVSSRKQPIRILSPGPKLAILGSSTSATLRTYISPDGGYTITYPSIWTPSTESQQNGFNGDVSVFSIGPVGNTMVGFPSFLQIAVDDNPQGLSLDKFITKQYGAVKLIPVTIGAYAGEQTTAIQGPTPNTTLFLKPATKIYQIRFFDGAEPKITKEALQTVLTSFTVQ